LTLPIAEMNPLDGQTSPRAGSATPGASTIIGCNRKPCDTAARRKLARSIVGIFQN
jgi:hypothetical protein